MIIILNLAHSILDVIKKPCGATYDRYTYLPFGSIDMTFSMFPKHMK